MVYEMELKGRMSTSRSSFTTKSIHLLYAQIIGMCVTNPDVHFPGCSLSRMFIHGRREAPNTCARLWRIKAADRTSVSNNSQRCFSSPLFNVYFPLLSLFPVYWARGPVPLIGRYFIVTYQKCTWPSALVKQRQQQCNNLSELRRHCQVVAESRHNLLSPHI